MFAWRHSFTRQQTRKLTHRPQRFVAASRGALLRLGSRTAQATACNRLPCARAPACPSLLLLCALTSHSSRRRFAARLNSGVRPGEKLSSVVSFGHCIALCVSCAWLGRRWSVIRELRFSLWTHRFGQRGCAAAKPHGLTFVFALGCCRVVWCLPLRVRGPALSLRSGGALASALPALACA